MSECVFCDLISKKKVDFLYEDDQVVAFADINPKSPVHALIVPREHISSVAEVTTENESVLGHLFTVAKQLASERRVAESGFRLVVNTGPDAGQSVHHIHMHLLAGEPLGQMNTKETA